MDITYKLIKYLTDISLEQHYYYVVPSLQYNTDIHYEVMWEKNGKYFNKPWKFRAQHTKEWTYCSNLDILDALSDELIDLASLKAQLHQSMILKVSYMDMKIKDAKDQFGEETIYSGIKAFEIFSKNLVKTVKKIIKQKDPTLTVVKD